MKGRCVKKKEVNSTEDSIGLQFSNFHVTSKILLNSHNTTKPVR